MIKLIKYGIAVWIAAHVVDGYLRRAWHRGYDYAQEEQEAGE